MASEDFAIVVGISRYPGMLDPLGKPNDLNAPVSDARAVAGWLRTGGEVPDENLHLILSPEPPSANDPQPAEARIKNAFAKVAQQVQNNGAAGRRLYLYFAGHGFSTSFDKCALYTADALRQHGGIIDLRHFNVPAYAQLFRDARLFSEFVVWMDCCGDPQPLAQLNPATLVISASRSRREQRTFWGLAAHHGYKALELPLADGQVRGAFTSVLLQGLEGAAADSQGNVTGEDLRKYILNHLPKVIPEAARRDWDVDVLPPIHSDPNILLVSNGAAPPEVPVELSFPQGSTGPATIRGGQQLEVLLTTDDPAERWEVALKPGLYAVERPDSGFRQAFEVTGETTEGTAPKISVYSKGPAVSPSPGHIQMYELRLHAQNPAAVINVIDAEFQRVLEATGAVTARLLRGVYKIRVNYGREAGNATDLLIVLDADTELEPHQLREPPVVSALPIPATARTHEFQIAGWHDLLNGSRATPLAPGQARFSCFARYWQRDAYADTAAVPNLNPLDGVTLVGAAAEFTLSELALAALDNVDPFAMLMQDTAPGTHILRHRLSDGRSIAHSVPLIEGWETQVAIERDPRVPALADDRGGFAQMPSLSVFMHPPGELDEAHARLMEAARTGLAEGRDILGGDRGAELRARLLEDFHTPIEALLGAHHLLLSHEKGKIADVEFHRLLDTVVRRLRDMVGDRMPDVEALSLACQEPELHTRIEQFEDPPLFLPGWRLLLKATSRRRGLVSEALWERARALVVMPPYLAFAEDAQSKAEQLERFTHAAAGAISAMAPASVDPGTGTSPIIALAPAPVDAGPGPRRVPRPHRAPRLTAGRMERLIEELGAPAFVIREHAQRRS